MLHFLGFIMITAGFTGIGYLLCEKYERRIVNIKEWRRALEFMISEIRYKKQPFFYVFKECEKVIRGEVGDLFGKCVALYESGEDDTRQIWERCIKEYVTEKKTGIEDKAVIGGLSSLIGYEEEEMQVNMLRLEVEQFDKYIEQLEEEKRVKKKITLLISSCSGVVLALLLV